MLRQPRAMSEYIAAAKLRGHALKQANKILFLRNIAAHAERSSAELGDIRSHFGTSPLIS